MSAAVEIVAAIRGVEAGSSVGTMPRGNTSGLAPLGRAVQVSPFEPAREKSVIELPKSVLDKERTIDMIVRVVEIGPACWPDEPARCAPGDIVFVAKMAGFMATGPLDGKPYRFVNDRDIFIKVTGGEVSHG